MESIDPVHSQMAGMDRPDFLANCLLQDGVAMHFQVIGEAARQLTGEERAEAPEIPWPQIVNPRHRISPDYRNVTFAIEWEIAQIDLGPLQTAAKPMPTARGE